MQTRMLSARSGSASTRYPRASRRWWSSTWGRRCKAAAKISPSADASHAVSASCPYSSGANMPKEFLNPPAMATPSGYTHVVSTRGQQIIYISGQIAFDRQGNLVGAGDLRAQAQQVYQNIKAALSAASVSFADVVKLNTYIVNYKPADRAILREVRDQ